MDKPSTSKFDHQDLGKTRKKSSDVTGENIQSGTLMPLHRRRFDAKHREFPRSLAVLPQSGTLTKTDSSKQFCEDLAERLRQEGSAEPRPLSERTASVAAKMVETENAFDHLDQLYKLMDQLLTIKDQNSKLQRRVRDLEHFKKLQEMHKQIEKEIQKSRTTDAVLLLDDATSMDLEEEYGYTEALLDSMLAAGRNASLKRAKWKSPSRSKFRQSIVGKQRSRSMGGEELENCGLGDVEYSSHLEVPYRGRMRRASDLKGSDEKSKISKWTRVKAAFKWEKAHTGVASEAPSVASISAPSPISPPQSVTPATPTTPGSMSSASSVEEMRNDRACQRHESARRSRSLDSSVALDPLAGPLPNDDELPGPSSNKLHKTPWGKMKDIIQTRKESVKKMQNRNSIKSHSDGKTSENHSLSEVTGCISHSESAEIVHEAGLRTPKRKTSSQEKTETTAHHETIEALRRTTPTLTVTMPSSEELTKTSKNDLNKDNLPKSTSQPHVGSNKHQTLKKQLSLDQVKKVMPRPQDSSDPDTSSPVPNRSDSKWKKVKKAFLTSASMSTPSSPSRHSAFFADYDADDLSSGDYSLMGAASCSGPSASRDLSEAVRSSADGRKESIEEEIRRDYEALQSRLSREFSDRAMGWSHAQGSPTVTSPRSQDWEKNRNQGAKSSAVSSGPSTPGTSPVSSLQTQEKIEADFRKRFQESQRPRGSMTPVLSSAQLSEDFRKKLEEWKKMKATNSVPPYTGEEADRSQREHDEKHTKHKKVILPPKKEVLVQTGAGFFRFEGISRSFTRKLHEWEKSRGIAPEASTSALLRESLARPPLPTLRTTGPGPWPSSHDRLERPGAGLCRLQRSQSVGSVREEGVAAPAPLAAAAPSSLSLNRLDECKDGEVSDAELDSTCLPEDGSRGAIATESSDSDGGPAALLVEVEDEEEETAAPLVACIPRPAPLTPVYRYGQAQERHRACENTEGKLSPIAHAVPLPPHPGTEQIPVIAEALSRMAEEEQSLQKLVQGHRNITDRCEDVRKQIEELKGLPTKSVARLVELERRVARLMKEKGILQNSVKERANNFNTSVSKLKKQLEIFKSKCEDSSDPLLLRANNILLKVDKFGNKSISRANYIRRGSDVCEDLASDLRSIQRSIDNLREDCNQCNIRRKDNNLCISYTVHKPKLREPDEFHMKDCSERNITSTESRQTDEPTSIMSNTSCGVSVKILDQSEGNKKSDSENLMATSVNFSDESSKGAKKKSKEFLDKSATNSAKRKAKARHRLEKEKSLQSESDTEGEVSTVTIEFPRRRKLLRTRRTSDTHVAYPRQNSFDKQSNTDSGDNIFVLKLKPSTPIDSAASDKDISKQEKLVKRTLGEKKRSLDSALPVTKSEKSLDKEGSVEILISPEQFSFDIPPEGIEIQASENTTMPDIFVKTTRKIFSPVRRDSKGKPKAVIGFDLDEIANSIEKRRVDMTNSKDDVNQENLPDIIFNNEVKKADNEAADQGQSKICVNESPTTSETKGPMRHEELRRQFSIANSESQSSIKSHTPSPLFVRKQTQQNSSNRNLSGSRNASEESIYQPKEILPIRRGSGERYFNGCKGSPVLSRSSTPGTNGASSSLPPLPASPPSSRRDKNKETAPSIRIMIQKYNKRLNEEGGEIKSAGGSNTPPWRSPRSLERFPHDVHRMVHHSSVRNNPFFNREVQKSASASQIMKNTDMKQTGGSQNISKDNVSDSSEMTPPMPKKLLRGILKSSSAGSLKTTSPLCQRKDFVRLTEPNPPEVTKQDVEENNNRTDHHHEDNGPKNDVPKESVILKTEEVKSVNVNEDAKKESIVVVGKPPDERVKIEPYKRKIDKDLLKRAISTPCAPMHLMEVDKTPINRSGSRAMRLKKAREQFLGSDIQKNNNETENPIRRDRSTSSNVDLAENRLSQISCGSDTSYEGNSLTLAANQSTLDQHGLLMKSASVGMINVERGAFDKFNKEKGYESLPRNQSNLASTHDQPSKSGSKFGLSNLASKFRKVRLRKGKQSKTDKNEEKERLNTVSKLCRQSLLVNLQGEVPPRKIIPNARERGGSQTDMSIVSAGKTGGAVAVGNEGFITLLDKGVCRSMSAPDGSSSSKQFTS